MPYIGNTPTIQSFTPQIDYFNGTGSQTAFTLSRNVASVAQVMVVVNNVPQKPGDAFTVLNNVITFTSAPSAGSNNIYVYYTTLNQQVSQPGYGTVGSDEMKPELIVQLSSVAVVSFFARNTAPSGWLKANGAAVSRATYSNLFTAIGTTFGIGDGSTTFLLPDLRGYFPRGWVDDGGIDTGRVFGSSQLDDNKPHVHSIGVQANNGASWPKGTAYVQGYDTANGGLSITSAPFNTAGNSGGTTESRPKNIALLACIKY